KYPMTNGTLHLEFWLFIEKGKGAYWNIQKKVDNKSMPVIQVFYDSVGGFEINSGIGNGINFIKGAYPQGEWFKMSLDLDIIKKEWSFSINDKYIGNCHQNFSSIVSLNFYPFLYLGRTKFFIDDVFYTYSGVEKYQTDISINEIISLSKGLANYKQSFDLIVESLGMDTLNSIEIKVKNDIGLINILNINKINIIPGSNFKLHFPDAITLHEGVNMIDVLISSINGKMDENISNNSIQFKVIGIKPGENKKVLNETIVSTWCGWSPRGYTFLDSLNAKYSDYSVGLQIHNQDGLSDRGYDSVFKVYPYFPGIPWSLTDRKIYDDPSRMEEAFLEQVEKNAPALLNIGAKYNMEMGVFNFQIKASFSNDMPNEKIINLIIAEKMIHGFNGLADQLNYYSNHSYGIMGGYENLPHLIPHSQISYRLVARKIFDDFFGNPSKFTQNTYSGDVLLNSFSSSLSFIKDIKNIELIAILIDSNGEIVTVANLDFEKALNIGLFTNNTDFSDNVNVMIQPNPVENKLYVEGITSDINLFSIRTIDGKSMVDGKWSQGMNVTDLRNGIYFLSLYSSHGTITNLKFIKTN
ncbi:MAG: T9SS type A sorting domain-containing protein, partial [Saprospiraceae bacterium]